jgi:hypothetical protein
MRQPVGAWILLDAESWIGPDGAGLATARLADERGYFGRAPFKASSSRSDKRRTRVYGKIRVAARKFSG